MGFPAYPAQPCNERNPSTKESSMYGAMTNAGYVKQKRIRIERREHLLFLIKPVD